MAAQLELVARSGQEQRLFRTATRERAAQFYAVSPETVQGLYMKAMIEQAKAFSASRKELLVNWRSMIEKDSAKS